MKRKITPVAVVDYLLAFFDRLLETLCQSLLSGMLACEGIRCYGAMAGRVGRCYAPHWAMSGGIAWMIRYRLLGFFALVISCRLPWLFPWVALG